MPFLDLKQIIDQAPASPGVYQMLDKKTDGSILYIGKARNLKKRLQSYLRSGLDTKTQALLGKVNDITVTLCKNEAAALLLECKLIKKHKPKYNILLKDDKTYPYLYFSTQHAFPRVDFIRTNKQKTGRYFGPYPSAGSVRDNMTLIQKIFKIRTCKDSVFANRSRPCLQHQIGRCTAPCVQHVSKDNYAKQVNQALQFLTGKNEELIAAIQVEMKQAAEKQDYEKAKTFRDQISQLRGLQDSNDSGSLVDNTDVIASAIKFDKAVIAVLQIRQGQCLGVHSYTPNLPNTAFDKQEIIRAFLTQYYLNPVREMDLPKNIIAPDLDLETTIIESALSDYWKKPFKLKNKRTSLHKQWIDMAAVNAQETLAQLVQDKENTLNQLTELKAALTLDELPKRIECFDISHHAGSESTAACVVFDDISMKRQSYRRFNLSDNCKPGDDYAAIKEAVFRRYKRQSSDPKEPPLPNIVLIDGGKGQLSQAIQALSELEITGVCCLGIAKGPKRLEGQEQVFVWKNGSATLLPLAFSNPCRTLLQLIRDEAHRFAITGHRKKSNTRILKSVLDTIPGIGKKRKAALLSHFGGLVELKKASIEQLATSPGISESLAKVIFHALHA